MRQRTIDPRMARLRDYIIESGVRVEEVAQRIGVTGRTVYNWMAGKGRVSPLASRPLDRYLANVTAAKEGK
jgi:transcriptional regulator with XRE-family HTH domain